VTGHRTRPNVSRLISPRPPSKPVAEKLLRGLNFRDPAAARGAIGRLHADEFQRRSLAGIFLHLLQACARSADPDRALINFERLVAALPNANMLYHYLREVPETLDLLVTIFAHSQALADTLTRDAKYFHFLIAPEMLVKPREQAWLDAELRRMLLPMRTPAERYNAVRRFRRRETLRIGARDLTGKATVEETTRELSNVADVCLQAVVEIAGEKLGKEFRLLCSVFSVQSPGFAVIGMGKLGGQELNYSSDVDVIFVYGEEGEFNPRLSYHEFYTKLAEEIIRAVGAPSEEGNIFRIDLRLRPEGKSGPLVRSLESCENYYAEYGETWERMALVKARCVAGEARVGGEFLRMVQPFVYRRHTGENIIRQMATLKQRIEQEIVREERLTRHVKLGIGGIREIEFIVQAFQVLRGAARPALRERSTLRALEQLVKAKVLATDEARRLADAYRFLRNVEHRLQMEMELQTHTIPDEERALYRLARSLGFKSVEQFENAQRQQTAAVRQIYAGILANAEQGVGPAPDLDVATAGFADPAAAAKILKNLTHGPGFGHVSARTQDAFRRLAPGILATAQRLACPDAALASFEKFVTAYGSRGLLYELLLANPKLLEMLLRLGDASRFLADALAQQPDLFDEICRGVSLTEPKNRARMLVELRSTDGTADAARIWKRGELVRIGIEDVMGLVDIEQTHQELTWLAEACLEFALSVAAGGERGGFAVIGMGKFGGQELGYGADLDVLFVSEQDGVPAIKRATELMAFMERQTGAGMLFKVDPRLRPDGEKGPLASSLTAHRDYYRQRAQLWERQALTKARFVAGDERLGHEFIEMARESVYAQPLTKAEWEQIRHMRHRIETERGDPRHRELEFKTGPGGLMDVEFVVQALQLQHGPAHPPLRTAHTLAALNRLMGLGLVDDEAGYHLRQGYLFLRRVESVLRRMDNTSVSRLPADPVEQARLAKRLGFTGAEDFLANYRRVVVRNRAVYTAYTIG